MISNLIFNIGADKKKRDQSGKESKSYQQAPKGNQESSKLNFFIDDIKEEPKNAATEGHFSPIKKRAKKIT